MKIKLIVPLHERFNIYMIHRMLCFNYHHTKGDDNVIVKTSLYIDGKMKDILMQKQLGTHISVSPSFDLLHYYLVNKHDEYDEEVWQEMNGGDHKIVELEVKCEKFI